MDLFNKVHHFESMKSYIYELNISLISLMFNSEKRRISLIKQQEIRLHTFNCKMSTSYIHLS